MCPSSNFLNNWVHNNFIVDQGRKGKLRRKNRGWHELVSLTKHFSFLILFFPRSVLLYSCFSRSRGRTLFNFLWLNSSIDCHWTLRSIFRLNSPLNFMLWQLFLSLGCFHRALSTISGNFSWIAKDYFILVSIEWNWPFCSNLSLFQ